VRLFNGFAAFLADANLTGLAGSDRECLAADARRLGAFRTYQLDIRGRERRGEF